MSILRRAIIPTAMLVIVMTSAGRAQDGKCIQTPAEIYASMAASVVQVVSFGVDPYRVAGRVRPGTGSGILIAPDLVLTNYHVVHDGNLVGVVSDTWAFDAEVIGGDPALDIAVLRLPVDVDPTPELSFGSYDTLVVGQPGFVIGYPLGIGRSIASGIVSGLDRRIPLNNLSWTTRYIQTDAAVSPGNSGGALVDACGRIIGVVSLASGDRRAENIGYALPIDTVLPLVDEILETGFVSRPWHGIYGQMMSPLMAQLMTFDDTVPPAGFLVETVEPGSAADIAGLRGGIFPVMWGMSEVLIGGDIITEVDGIPIRDLNQALAVVENLEIGDTVQVQIWRDGLSFDFAVKIPQRPQLERDLWINGQRNLPD